MVAQDRVGWTGAVLVGEKKKTREENRVQRAVKTKDANVPQWITPKYSTTVGIVRNHVDRALVVSAMSGAVFQDNSFSAADRRH